MYQHNKYLDALGIKLTEYGTNWIDEDTDTRGLKWKEERAECGFDTRETWDLSLLSIEWLYSHLKMYDEVASPVIDMDKTIINNVHMRGELIEKTNLREVLNYLIEVFEEYLKLDFIAKDKMWDNVKEALYCWADTFIYFWW